MSFRVVIPGQPPSLNHAYHVVRVRRGPASFSTLAKTPEAVAYQQAAKLIVGTARPTGWSREGHQVQVVYELYLARDIDADNVLKVLGDAVAQGLGIDDKWILPCIKSKRSGLKPGDAKVVLEIKLIIDGRDG